MLSSLVIWGTLSGWAHAETERYNPGDQIVDFTYDNSSGTTDFYWEDITKYDSPEEKKKVSVAFNKQDLNTQVSVRSLVFPQAQAGDQRTIRWAETLANGAKVNKVSVGPPLLGPSLT